MWNLVSSNRLIDKRNKQEAHRKHILALHAVKPSINNATPSQYSFLYSRPKQQQLKIERQNDIESSNTILVDRMMHSSSWLRPKNKVHFKDSLNSVYRSRVQREIDDGNQKLVRRLQSAKSQYQNVGKTMQEYKRLKSNMAFSRMDPFYDLDHQSVPVQSRKPARPYSAKR